MHITNFMNVLILIMVTKIVDLYNICFSGVFPKKAHLFILYNKQFKPYIDILIFLI